MRIVNVVAPAIPKRIKPMEQGVQHDAYSDDERKEDVGGQGPRFEPIGGGRASMGSRDQKGFQNPSEEQKDRHNPRRQCGVESESQKVDGGLKE